VNNKSTRKTYVQRKKPTPPAPKNSFKGITDRSKSLIESDENHLVDYKRSVSGLESDDLVAFANSDAGGVILLGVQEIKSESGRQKGEIVGHKIGDSIKGSIVSRAQNCSPPIKIEIFLENTATEKPFYRIEIPSGAKKPYSTSGGTYKIRRDGQNAALKPQELLSMFLSEESDQFLSRFRDSTLELEKRIVISEKTIEKLSKITMDSFYKVQENIERLNDDVRETIEETRDRLVDMESSIEEKLKEIFDISDNANSLADDGMIAASEAQAGVEELNDRMRDLKNQNNYIENAIKAILFRFDIEDPDLTNIKFQIKSFCVILKRIAREQSKIITREELIKQSIEIVSRNAGFQLSIDEISQIVDES
jgi:ATP-dependent DNA helicase RecG